MSVQDTSGVRHQTWPLGPCLGREHVPGALERVDGAREVGRANEDVVRLERRDEEELDLAAASGVTIDAVVPVSEKSNGAIVSSNVQPRSTLSPSGTSWSRQTTDTSLLVRVTERNGPMSTHGGSSEPGSRRTTA